MAADTAFQEKSHAVNVGVVMCFIIKKEIMEVDIIFGNVITRKFMGKPSVYMKKKMK